jgi:hypothetical protein
MRSVKVIYIYLFFIHFLINNIIKKTALNSRPSNYQQIFSQSLDSSASTVRQISTTPNSLENRMLVAAETVLLYYSISTGYSLSLLQILTE